MDVKSALGGKTRKPSTNLRVACKFTSPCTLGPPHLASELTSQQTLRRALVVGDRCLVERSIHCLGTCCSCH